MDIKQLIRNHLAKVHVMQLATTRNNQPWVCNVHFAYDDGLNLYWMSVPNCRHSEDIAVNPHVAVAMAIHTEPPLIGVQIEGDAEQLEFAGNEAILHIYAERHNRATLVEDALSGRIPFKLYRLTPRLLSTFDQQSFPDKPKQEWRP